MAFTTIILKNGETALRRNGRQVFCPWVPEDAYCASHCPFFQFTEDPADTAPMVVLHCKSNSPMFLDVKREEA